MLASKSSGLKEQRSVLNMSSFMAACHFSQHYSHLVRVLCPQADLSIDFATELAHSNGSDSV